MSLICSYTSLALQALRERTARITLLGEPRKLMFEYHFGPRAGEVERLIQRGSGSLATRSHDRLIVLNMDIRGSTELAKQCGERDRPREYAAFIAQYQQTAREVAHMHGGVVDKTMGDGVHILFNVYREGILEIGVDQSWEAQQAAALECASDIAVAFGREVESVNRKRGFGVTMHLALGAGLASGTGFIGGFETSIAGFEYTVLGDVANRAGKLVGLARPDTLAKELMEGKLRLSRQSQQLNRRELRSFLSGIQKMSVLLADWNFFDPESPFADATYEIEHHPTVSPMFLYVLPLVRRAPASLSPKGKPRRQRGR